MTVLRKENTFIQFEKYRKNSLPLCNDSFFFIYAQTNPNSNQEELFSAKKNVAVT